MRLLHLTRGGAAGSARPGQACAGTLTGIAPTPPFCPLIAVAVPVVTVAIARL